ncbi:MAG: tRNA 2-selenouridine(34) synthase MnmH [Bacteroidota bacterium]
MPKIIKPEDYLRCAGDRVLLDVRSPGEYEQGHLFQAQSLPLFDDVERAEVGTLYKQDSPDAALLRGLEIAGSKMRHYVERARQITQGKPVTVHCWRGGQRSQSMGWLLERAGMDVQILEGGYKNFRRWQRRYLAESTHTFIIIGGPTGAGKTRLLEALAEQGESVIDLEGLARHRGSSFGAIGQPEAQPTTEQFENELFARLYAIPPDQGVYLEDESRMIGTACIPDAIFDRMQSAPLIALEVSTDRRLQQLVEEYGQFPQDQLADAFTRITKRLGGQHVKSALESLQAGDLSKAAEIALVYYDKAYARSSRKPDQILSVADREEWGSVAERLKQMVAQF